MNARQFRTYLNSIRAPVAAMAEVPAESVIVYAQQDLGEHIGAAMAAGSCAVMLGVTGWSGKAEARVSGPPVEVTMEVSVWTPEVVMREDAPTTLDVAEAITHGLHGRVPPEGSPGLSLIPKFRDARMTTQTLRQGDSRYIVATLIFEFPVALRALRPAD
ncbi:MAG: hypothetical protein V4726_07340 [Verrucomicrobiota bacterium]